MLFGIGKLCLEKKYDQNINVPNKYAFTVICVLPVFRFVHNY